MTESTPHEGRPWRIDVHHHVVPPQFVATTPMPFPVPDTATQLHSMDEFDIAAAMTSLTPRVFLHDPARRRDTARACNEYQAELIRDYPTRFGAFAVLPLPDVDGALAELAYALDVLKLDGVGLFSSFENVFLGDPLYEPLFAELHRRRATVFVHPAHCAAPPELNLRAPGSAVEYLFDSTRAIVNMLYTRAFRRYPDVRYIFSHGGATVPFIARRLAGLERSSDVPDVIGTLRTLNYDIASGAASPWALRSLQELVPPTQLYWGTDLPFVSGAKLREEVEEWEAYDGFHTAARAAIERENALRIFPRLAGQTV
jgi:predicted TIM-barrel fold metal-dependent hydrolase